jgi:hypothetical protein
MYDWVFINNKNKEITLTFCFSSWKSDSPTTSMKTFLSRLEQAQAGARVEYCVSFISLGQIPNSGTPRSFVCGIQTFQLKKEICLANRN